MTGPRLLAIALGIALVGFGLLMHGLLMPEHHHHHDMPAAAVPQIDKPCPPGSDAQVLPNGVQFCRQRIHV